MQINSLLQSAASQAAGRVNTASAAKSTEPIQSASATRAASSDQLDLSPEAQALSAVQASGEQAGIRFDKVAAIRQAIADGSYETPEKLDIALDKMLDTFA